MLPFVGISAWAILQLLARWAWREPRGGGMKDADHKRACEELLMSLLRLVARFRNGAPICIDLDPQWEIRWPRPVEAAIAVDLPLNVAGQVNFAAFLEKFMGSGGRSPWAFGADFRSMCAGMGATVSLIDLFKASFRLKNGNAFWKQLLWQLGASLQGAIGAAMREAVPGLQVKVFDMADALYEPSALDLELVRYTMKTRSVSEPHHCFSACTDKSAVGGLGSGLQNFVFGVEGNVAFYGPPQAARTPGGTILCGGVPFPGGVVTGAGAYGERGPNIVLRDVVSRDIPQT